MNLKINWSITRLLGGLDESRCTLPEPAKFADGHGKKYTPKYSHHDVIAHIECYRPTLSDYRSKHAPMWRYLLAEISVKSMYQDFKDKYACEVSNSSFYGIFKSMTISMTLVAYEECEVFQYHDLHKKNGTCEAVCDVSKCIDHKSITQEPERNTSKTQNTLLLMVRSAYQPIYRK